MSRVNGLVDKLHVNSLLPSVDIKVREFFVLLENDSLVYTL